MDDERNATDNPKQLLFEEEYGMERKEYRSITN